MIADPSNPVYRMETRRQVSSRRLLALQRGCLPVLATVTTISLTLVAVPFLLSSPFSFDAYISQLLTGVLVVLLAIQVLAGVGIAILTIGQAAPAISGELEVQSWGLLRTTTLPLRAIIFGKFTAVMARLRTPLISVLLLRFVSTVTVLLLLLVALLRGGVYNMRPGDINELVRSGLWVPIVAAFLAVLIFYLTQPIIQFWINTSLGLFYSALTRSQGRALASGLAGRLILWVVLAGVYGLALRLLVFIGDNAFGPNVAPFLIQITPNQSILLTVGVISGAVLLVWSWQAGLILFMLGWVHRRSSRLGAA